MRTLPHQLLFLMSIYTKIYALHLKELDMLNLRVHGTIGIPD